LGEGGLIGSVLSVCDLSQTYNFLTVC
jgi:hypothetical protein